MKNVICMSNKQVLRKSSILAAAVAAAFALPEHLRRAVGVQKPENIIDAQQQFSDSQALSATALATNVVDLSQARAIGNGEPMVVLINVEVAADIASSDETYQFDLETASDSGITTARKLLGRRRYTFAATAPDENANLLVAGFKFVIPVPQSALSESSRFLGVRYTLGGTTPSVTVSAYLQPAKMVEVGQVSFPKGYTIS